MNAGTSAERGRRGSFERVSKTFGRTQRSRESRRGDMTCLKEEPRDRDSVKRPLIKSLVEQWTIRKKTYSPVDEGRWSRSDQCNADVVHLLSRGWETVAIEVSFSLSPSFSLPLFSSTDSISSSVLLYQISFIPSFLFSASCLLSFVSHAVEGELLYHGISALAISLFS